MGTIARRRALLTTTLIATALSAFALSGAAQAQTTADKDKAATASGAAEPTQVQDVVVTATKRETTLMKTPVAVTAVTADTLQRNNITDVRELGAQVPAMQVGFSPTTSGVQVSIRGVTSNNFTELGDPAIGIHLDGVYSPRPQAGMALFQDIDRIEVLRGPQGTLFGRNSTGGAINILSKRPSFAGESFEIDGEYANFNRRALHFVLNKPITDDLAFRLAFGGEKSDGYITQVQDKTQISLPFAGVTPTASTPPGPDQRFNTPVDKAHEYTAVDRWSARGSLLWRPSDRFSWLITYDHYRDNSPGNVEMQDCKKSAGYFMACNHPTYYASINVPGQQNLATDSLRQLLTFKPVEGVKVEYRVALTRERHSQTIDGDGGVFASPNDPAIGIPNRICCGYSFNFGPLLKSNSTVTGLGFDPSVVGLFPIEDLQERIRWSRFDSLVQEMQIKSDGSQPLKWVVGLFDSREKNAIRFDVDQPYCCELPRPLAASYIQPDRESDSTAVFGQADYAVTSQVNVTAGYRYTWDHKQDRGGSNHETIGYYVNPGQFDPSGSFYQESWAQVGPGVCYGGPGIACFPAATGYLSNAFTLNMGTFSPTFLQRVPGTNNSYKADWSKGTWKVGFDYTPTKDLFVYGSIATGYKAGGFSDQVDTCNAGCVTFFQYKPETDINYELAMKGRFFHQTLNLIATIYDTEFTNLQTTNYTIVGRDPNSGAYVGSELTLNTAASRSRGIELEEDWIPYKGGHVTGWVSLTDATITKYAGGGDGFFCFQRAYLHLQPCPAENAQGVRPESYVGHHLPRGAEIFGHAQLRAQLVSAQRSAPQSLCLGALPVEDVLRRQQPRRWSLQLRPAPVRHRERRLAPDQRKAALGDGALCQQPHRRAGAAVDGPGPGLDEGDLFPAPHLRIEAA